jgi:hypothetical protein
VVAAFIDVFPDAILWIGPNEPTGILLGRTTTGSEPLGRNWPGLDRDFVRPLPNAIIARSTVLDINGLRTFASSGRVITDDNQLLAYGLLRTDLFAGQFTSVSKKNLRRIRTIANLQPPISASTR